MAPRIVLATVATTDRGHDPGSCAVSDIFLRIPLLWAQAEGAAGDGSSLTSLLFPFLAIGLLFYFMMIRPQRREQASRQEMLQNLKKNDRVLTIGGIYGVVTNVHQEADEITLKVDEATNAKLRVTLSSISRVLNSDTNGEKNNT